MGDTHEIPQSRVQQSYLWTSERLRQGRVVLSEIGIVYYLGQHDFKQSTDAYIKLQLVVSTTSIDEILLKCHASVEGGNQRIVRIYNRVVTDYYWTEFYANVAKHVQGCEDCSISKSKPHLRGYSLCYVVVDRPFQVVLIEFFIPLPMT